MALVACPSCSLDDDIHVVAAEDGVKTLECALCGWSWEVRREPLGSPSQRSSFEQARGRFTRAEMMSPERRRRVARLRKRFLEARGTVEPPAPDHSRFRRLLGEEALRTADPSEVGAVTRSAAVEHGRPMIVRRAWELLGEDEASRRVVASLTQLLHGPAQVPVEDRLTELVVGTSDDALPGLTESFYMHVLHVASPERFLPAMAYATGKHPKRDLALDVFGLHLPQVDATTMQIGRMAVWSNDLLVELAGPGFRDTTDAAAFLTWSRDAVGRPRAAVVR